MCAAAAAYPWTWLAHHFEEFLADLPTGEPPLKVSTLRSYTTAIRAFTRYVSDTRYGWVVFCERVFNDIPAQIVFDWNSPRHSTDDGLADLAQGDLDTWQSGGTTTRGIASRFLGWAITCRLIDPDLRLTPHRRGTSPKLGAQAQAEAIEEHVHSTDMPARHRAIAILLLVFGQPLERLVALTWDDVDIAGDPVMIRLGGTADIELHAPLDEPFRQLAEEPHNHQTAAHPNSHWVFPGYSPGRHLDAGYIAARLRTTVGARAARMGTLHELTKLAPTAIIAEVLGYSPATIEKHAVGSAANYATEGSPQREGTSH